MRKPVAMFAGDGGPQDRFGDSLLLRRGRHRGGGMEEANRLEDKQARKNDSQRPARRSIEICVPRFHAAMIAVGRFVGQTEKRP